MLRIIIQKNLKNWKDCLSFVEFTYNQNMHSIINYSTLKIVYDFNPLNILDLIHLLVDENVSFDENKKTQAMNALYENVEWKIQKKKKKNEQYGFKERAEKWLSLNWMIEFICIYTMKYFFNIKDLS